MADLSFSELGKGQRAERKLLITVVEWKDGATTQREILGTRTEDSSIEYNADIQTSTDIRGINYTDINKTQPQQQFDPFLILGGSALGAKLNDIRRRNALSELSQFTVYIITAFSTSLSGTGSKGYDAERHSDCTISYDSFGGDSNVNFPITVYLSNDYQDNDGNSTGAPQLGTVDKLTKDFVFTAVDAASVS